MVNEMEQPTFPSSTRRQLLEILRAAGGEKGERSGGRIPGGRIPGGQTFRGQSSDSRGKAESRPATAETISSQAVSGERLGSMLGISRVSVHKHVQILRDQGYSIETSRKGYRLYGEALSPFTSHEFRQEENITVLPSTTSTMEASLRFSENHPKTEFTLAALTQNAGRGRAQRKWESPEGGLWVTRVIHPAASALRIQLYVMGAAAALARVLEQRGIPRVSVKWPNDVFAGEGKIAGILGEALVSGDRISRLALGMGMNVNNTAPAGAVSLRELTGREEDRRELLRDWIAAMDALRNSPEFCGEEAPRWWNSRTREKGCLWSVRTASGRFSGRNLGTDSLGRLVLQEVRHETKRKGSGIRRYIPAGEVLEIRRKKGSIHAGQHS